MTFAWNSVVYWGLVLAFGIALGIMIGWLMCETRHRREERRKKRVQERLEAAYRKQSGFYYNAPVVREWKA